MKISLLEYKLQIREYITHNSKKLINFKLVISFLPIFLGIYNNLYYKYNKQTILTCFKNNLPGICLEPTKISWQTFDQKLVQELKLSFQNIDFSNSKKSLIIPNEKSKKKWITKNFHINQNLVSEADFQNSDKNFSLYRTNNKNADNEFSIQQINFYNNFILININKNFQKKQKKLYIGIFSEINLKFGAKNLKIKNSIGHNWLPFSAKKVKDKSFKTYNYWKPYFKKTLFENFWEQNDNGYTQNNLLQMFTPKFYKKFTKILFSNPNHQCNTYLPTLISSHYLNQNLIKYQIYLNLDELPIKLNHCTIKKKISKNQNSVTRSLAPVSFKNGYDLKNKSLGSQNICKKYFFKKKNDPNFNLKLKKFQNIAENLYVNSRTQNFTDAKSLHFTKLKKKKFLLLKISNFSTFFSINNFFNKKKKKSNLAAIYNKSILLKGIPNFNFFPIIKNSQHSFANFQNVVENSDNTFFSILKKKKINFSEASKLIFKAPLKINFLQHLIKQYSLNTNFTPIADYKLINFFNLPSENLISESKKTNIQIINNSKLQYSFELLKCLEQFTPITQNKQLAPRIMSGYFLPDINNKNNLFTLRTMNNFLVNIKISKNFLHQNLNDDYITFNIKKFLPKILAKQAASHKFKQDRCNVFFQSTQFPESFKLLSQSADYIKKKKTGKKIQYYSGPAITQNKQTNDLEIKNSLKIKINQSFYSDNPLTDHQESFFGKNISYLNSEKLQIGNDNISKNEIQDKNVFFIKLPLLKLKKNISKKFSLKYIPITYKTKINLKKYIDNNVSSYKTICLPIKIFSKKNAGYILFLNNSDWVQFLTTLKNIKTNLSLDSQLPITFFSYISNQNFGDEAWQFDLETNRPGILFNYRAKNLQLNQQRLPFIFWPVNQLDFCKNVHFFRSTSEKTNRLRAVKKKSNEIFFKHHNFSNCASVALSQTCSSKKINTFFDQQNCVEKFFNYYYFPYLQNLVRETASTKFLFGKIYKKNYSVFTSRDLKKNTNQTKLINQKKPNTFSTLQPYFNYQNPTNKIRLFYQIIEPLNSNSWLFVTQFSIGFFLISIFTNILQKYQQEMNYAISSLLENKDFNSNEINLDQNSEQPKFKNIQKVLKNFDNIAGIDTILPELAEIIWFLRNSSRSFKKINNAPQRILLTGPPGTGKTLLVQAIAGEAEVPILVESGSSLAQSEISISSSEKLKNLFNQARQMAPCIIFIDEIDTFGQARNAMMFNPVQNNSILDSIYKKNQKSNNYILDSNKTKTFFSNIDQENSVLTHTDFIQNQSFSQNQEKLNQEKANLLLQFLIELDSISNDKRIIVFGATNREQTLDLALTRPGRFNKILKLKLPNKQKRIEIIKLYTKNLGFAFPQTNKKLCYQTNEKNLSWDYLANLTLGLSAADLASAINQSAIKAIQIETSHTLETIEYGIKSITGYITQKNKLKTFAKINRQNYLSGFQKKIENKFQNKNQLSIKKKNVIITRLAFYQAGKLVVHTLLQKHPAIISICLWPQLQNFRYHLMNNIFEKEFSQLFQKVELESRLVGFYAGKAGEFLGCKKLQLFKFSLLQNKLKKSNLKEKDSIKRYFKKSKQTVSNNFWIKNRIQLKKAFYLSQSDFGVQDISFANWLTELMVSKFFFYCKKKSMKKSSRSELLCTNSFFQNLAAERIFVFSTNLLQSQLWPNQTKYSLKQQCNKQQILNISINNSLKQKSNKIKNILNLKKSIILENHQNWQIRSDFQKRMIQKLGDEPMGLKLTYSKKSHWYKIYGGDHQENENTKYIQSDLYYHNNFYLNNLKWFFSQPVINQNYVNLKRSNAKAKTLKNKRVKPYVLRKFKFKSTGFLNQFSFKRCTQPNFKTRLLSKKIYLKNNLIFLCKKPNYKISFCKYKLNNEFSNQVENFNCSPLVANTIINWNEILKVNHNYISENLNLICFNKSISILNYNRELLDIFINYLLQNEILREYQIKQIAQNFVCE